MKLKCLPKFKVTFLHMKRPQLFKIYTTNLCVSPGFPVNQIECDCQSLFSSEAFPPESL